MGDVGRLSTGWPIAVMVALLAANLPLVNHYLGSRVALLYVLLFVAWSVAVWKCFGGRYEPWPILLGTMIVASLGLQIAFLLVVAPRFDQRMDRDDALSLWIEALVRGDYPYAVTTQRGNPISVLPFMHLLAAPFHLLGNVGYLPIAAYLFLVWLLWRVYRPAKRWQVFTLALLSSAPLLFFEVSGRSDLIANLALVVLVIFVLERSEGRPWGSNAWKLGILLGCLAATRLALLPVLGLLFLFMVRTLPGHALKKALLAAVAVFGVLVLPLAAWHPETFFRYAPIGVNSTKLGPERSVAVFWLCLTAAVTLLLGFLVARARHLYASAALLLTMVMAATWLTFSPDLTYLQMPFVLLLFALPREDLRADSQPGSGNHGS